MLNYLSKKLRFRRIQNRKSSNKDNSPESQYYNLCSDLKKNLDIVKEIFGTSNDVIIREFNFGYEGQISGALIYIDGLTDMATINVSIIKPLMYDSGVFNKKKKLTIDNIEAVKANLISVGSVEKITLFHEVVDKCLSGNTIFLMDGSNQALAISSSGWETRGVEEPKTESVVRGPREGFSETLRTNTALLRRKIKNPELTFEMVEIGKRTKTNVCIAYLKKVANPKLIEEIRRRLGKIDTDAILESGYIEQFIEDAPFSIFSTVANSEKPDTIAAKILEGRAAIIVDGTPFVLTVPLIFIENFQSAEDYYTRPFFASMIRMLRFLAFSISILAPALYVALTTFHQELIPTLLLLTMTAAHEGVPFPAVVEAGIMVIVFEILKEAGVRLPRPVGQAVSIVGALVIGEATVSAGLIGAPMVIVVSLTAVCSFAVPPLSDTSALLRIIFLVLSGVMGGYGISVGLLGIMVHLASLRSFGTPYFSPLAPLSSSDLKDVFVRMPIWSMFAQPRVIAWRDRGRQGFRSDSTSSTKENGNGKDS